jgi:outer membrane receptor protein involved in Fe transport
MTPPTRRCLRAAPVGHGWTAGLTAAALLSLAVPAAQAAEARVFRIPAGPLPQALETFALQGRVSVSGLPPGGCGGPARPVSGVLSPEAALTRLLPEGCRFEMPDPSSFTILRAAAAPARSPAPPRPAPPTEVDQLIITAERRIEPLNRSAYAVSALPAEEIQRLGGRSFSEAASQFAGVNVTNLGSGRNKVFIRGISDGAFTGLTQSTVGLYLDDTPITYNAPDPDLRLADIDRVEVLRGPQGSLYGSGSIGGVVRIVTNLPDPTGYAGEVTLSGETAQHGAQSAGYELMVNAPLGLGDAAARAVIYRDERGGYIDLPRLGLSNANYSRRTGGRLAVSVSASPDWTLDAGVTRQSIDTRDSQYVEGSGGRLTRDTQVREPHDNDFTEFHASASRSGAEADLRLSAAFIDHTLDTRYDATGAFASEGFGASPTAYDQGQRAKLWTLEAVAKSSAPGRLQWLAGAYASHTSEGETAQVSAQSGPPLERSVYARHDRLDEAALYSEASYQLTHRLSATVGARVFLADLHSTGGDFGLAPRPMTVTDRLVNRGFAPKVRLSYAPGDNLLVYVQAQEGYRTGGLNVPILAFGTAAAAGLPRTFKPDRLWSYEAGWRVALPQQNLELSGALFYARWRDVQTDQYLPSGLPLTVNIGDASNVGLEAEIVWRPTSRLRLRTNLLLDDPELTRPAALFPARVDIGLPAVPAQMAAVDLRYRWPVGRGLEASVSGQFAYQSHSYLTFAGGPSTVMGGYGVGRLEAEIGDGRWGVSCFVDNVTDETGNTFAFGNPFQQRSAQSTPLRPRTLGLILRRRL